MSLPENKLNDWHLATIKAPAPLSVCPNCVKEDIQIDVRSSETVTTTYSVCNTHRIMAKSQKVSV